MNIRNILKGTPKPEPKTNAHRKANKKPKNLSVSQQQVLFAIQDLGASVNGMTIARYMKVDSASVTPRLAELRKQGKIVIAYTKVGLDKRKRNFYKIANPEQLYWERLEQDKGQV